MVMQTRFQSSSLRRASWVLAVNAIATLAALGPAIALPSWAQTPPAEPTRESLGRDLFGNDAATGDRPTPCQSPVLERLRSHRVANGETLASIAAQYNLMPATIMGFNPAARTGSVAPGTTLRIPPYNGIRATVSPGTTWREVGQAYGIRPGVLYEVNGCVAMPREIFVPGVTWSPLTETGSTAADAARSDLTRYPLPQLGRVLVDFGWRVDPATAQTVFSSGVALEARPGDRVGAVGPGVVAFVGDREGYGTLVAINHANGRQTRYANLATVAVTRGQTVAAGETVGTVPTAGDRAYLLFEVRHNSAVGWVAQNPRPYLRSTAPVIRRIE
jgi:murein DD-endopeptidase MepM/ murein hydrolase activator NlpD